MFTKFVLALFVLGVIAGSAILVSTAFALYQDWSDSSLPPREVKIFISFSNGEKREFVIHEGVPKNKILLYAPYSIHVAELSYSSLLPDGVSIDKPGYGIGGPHPVGWKEGSFIIQPLEFPVLQDPNEFWPVTIVITFKGNAFRSTQKIYFGIWQGPYSRYLSAVLEAKAIPAEDVMIHR